MQRTTHGLTGATELAHLVREFDWGSTPLGPIAGWAETLRCAVNLVLGASLPMQLLWGPEMVVIYNDAMRLFMTGKHPQALGQPGRLVWSEAWPQVEDQLEQVRCTGEPVSVHDVFLPLMRSGVLEDMYWDYSYSPVYAPDGSIAGILNVSQNTTAQNVSRLQLQASEAQARRVLRSIGDAVIVTDMEAKVVRMNPVAERLTGWSEAAAVSLPLDDVFAIVNETTRLKVDSPVNRLKRTGKLAGLANHTILIRRDGSEVHIDDSGAPILDDAGAMTGLVLVFRDIGDRRRAEKERDAAYTHLQLITNSLPAFVSYLGPDLRYVHANRAYRDWLNVPPDGIVGKTIVEVLGAENAAKIQGRLEATLTGQTQGLEFRLETPAGDRVISATYIPDFDENGAVRGVIVQGYDITDRKRTEEALIQSEKLAAVGRLAASIAHEINNPLESVTNLLYLARADAESETMKEYLDIADRELRRIGAITSQTLKFHRQSTRPTEVSAAELVASVTSLYQGRIVNSRIQVEQRLLTNPILCFDGEIRQVLNNLVSNAIDAMHPGGGRLIFRSREGTEWKTGRRGVVLTVADTGPGMDPHAANRAFEAFFTTKGIGGTGLGLWISLEIIRRHGGLMRLRSSQKEGCCGTVFAFFLPSEAVTR